MKKILISSVILGMFLLSFYYAYKTASRGENITSNEVTVNLKVVVMDSGPVAELQFSNGTDARIGLLKYNAGVSGRIENNVFRIQTDSIDIPYTGFMVRRGEPKSGDYVWLKPGRSREVTVPLDGGFLIQGYDFLEGEHVYTARYDAVHQQLEDTPLIILKSNEATFTFRK